MEVKWFVTVSCAAEALGCRRSDIYDLLTKGLLEFILMPSKEVKVSADSLETFSMSPHVYRNLFPNFSK